MLGKASETTATTAQDAQDAPSSVTKQNETQESAPSLTTEQTKSNFNPYSYPPPSLGMPIGGIPPHLLPHMAQMMQNGAYSIFMIMHFPYFVDIYFV